MASKHVLRKPNQSPSEYFEGIFGKEFIKTSDPSNIITDISTILPLDAEDGIVMVYFGANWCPPCKKFVPSLAKTYAKLKEKEKAFELIYVSSDNDQEEYDEKIGTLPGYAIPFSNQAQCKTIMTDFALRGVPQLILLHVKTGLIVTYEGRKAVLEDPEGEDFPWRKFSSPERQAMKLDTTQIIIVLVIALLLIPILAKLLQG